MAESANSRGEPSEDLAGDGDASELRLSVVIPCHNAAPFLREALESVRRQSRPVWEIIVVDDWSTDDSAAILDEHPVRVLRTPRHAGPAAARNCGIRAATGGAIAFLDADDVWDDTHCEVVAGLLERCPEAGIAFSRVAGFGDSEWVSAGGFPSHRAFDALELLLRRNVLAQPTVIARREALLRVGGYDERDDVAFSEDYDLWLRLAAMTPFVGVDSVTARYRVHPRQRSQHVERLVAAQWTARRRVWEAMPDGPPRRWLGLLIRDQWRRELRRAWLQAQERTFDALLAQHHLVPGSEIVTDRWRRRRLLWKPWRTASRVVRRVPFPWFRRAGNAALVWLARPERLY